MVGRARKRLGQHFLHDPAVIARIVATIAPQPGDLMVEIGGGRGALTIPLLRELPALHVVEVDTELAAGLARLEGCIVHRCDALEFDFGSLTREAAGLRVVGNLPYNISTPLLFHLLEQRELVRDMHLMLQKEVVQRMVAAPGGKDYGRLTVMLSAWAEITHCFDIGPGAFTPAPRVWSSFVRVVPRRLSLFPIADQRRFATLVSIAFSMRRKTLARSLSGQVSRAQIAAAGVDPGARPETLRPQDFARLAAVDRNPEQS